VFEVRKSNKQQKNMEKKLTHEEIVQNGKPVPGFPNYVVLEDSRVYNQKRKVFVSERETPRGSTYKTVILSHEGESKQFYVHKLTAELWVENPNPFEFDRVRRKVGTSNEASNLEWTSHKLACKLGRTGEKERRPKRKTKAKAA
jgi:hypothetical protein